MSMLDNAVSSIRLGVEDFQAALTDEARALSAIRNLTAGLLLMFKVRLQELSAPDTNEALLKHTVIPSLDAAGNPSWIGKGGKTVDVEAIKTRLEGLGVRGIDWSQLLKLTILRNEVEHYYTSHPTAGLLEAMSASFHLIQQFVPTYLNRTPVQLLGEPVWEFLTEQESFHNRELEVCRKTNTLVPWAHPILASNASLLQCPKCRSELVKARLPAQGLLDIRFDCARCGSLITYAEAVEAIVTKIHYADLYYAATKGGEAPIYDCSQCGHFTYVIEDELCLLCLENSPARGCAECGSTLDHDDYDPDDDVTKLCSFCRSVFEMN